MADWSGIDLRGRIMLHPPWTAGKPEKKTFPCPAKPIIETAAAFKEAGGSIAELAELLNNHFPEGEENLEPAELMNPENFYSLEFQYYLVQFTKLLLNDQNFRYFIDEKTQLGENHVLYEKSNFDFPLWIIDDGGLNDGYLSITNTRSLFLYLEEKHVFNCSNPENEDLGKRISEETIKYIKKYVPEKYQFDRSFFEKEGILISFELMGHVGGVIMALANAPDYFGPSLYYGFRNHNQIAMAIFLRPELSPVECFQEWQKRTNNIYRMEFRSGRRKFFIKLTLKPLVQSGMFEVYLKNSIANVEQAVPEVHKAFIEHATGEKVRSRLIKEKDAFIYTVKISWQSYKSSMFTILTVFISGFLVTFGVFYGKRYLAPQFHNAVSALVIGVIAAGCFVTSLNWRKRLSAVKSRFLKSRDVLDKQLDSLKATTNELLVEKDHLDSKVKERTVELNDALEQLKALDRGKTNFIANVSHELRTPLTLLSVSLEGIKEGRYGEKLTADDQVFNLIERNVKRLNNQINQLLDFSRLDLGTIAFEPHNIELTAFCRLLMAELESLAEKKGLYLKMENETGKDELIVSADERLFERLLLNLLNNALKFTEKGGITLVLRAVEDFDQLELRVEDTGIGIPSEDKDRLFQRFTQADDSEERHREGAGLGLALVKEIAELHGWALDAEGREGEGAVFTAVMPLIVDGAADTLSAGVSTDSRKARQEMAETGIFFNSCSELEEYSEDRDTILIVEDNPDMGTVLRELLKDHYNLKWCTGGQEALEWLDGAPDLSLIICDVMMPGMSGFRFRDELLKNSTYDKLSFIFLTALADPHERTKGLKSGAVDYIRKPFASAELLLKVRNVIDSHKATYLQAVKDRAGVMRMERLTAVADSGHEPDWSTYRITTAEQRIIELVRQGLQDKEIAAELSISPRTVSSHLGHLYIKTDTQNRTELINKLYT